MEGLKPRLSPDFDQPRKRHVGKRVAVADATIRTERSTVTSNEKPVVDVVGGPPAHTSCDLEPVHASWRIGSKDALFRRAFDCFVDFDGPILPWELPDLDCIDGCIKVVEEVMSLDFSPTPAVCHDTKALGMPGFCMLKRAIGMVPRNGRMLVLGARGPDIGRLEAALRSLSRYDIDLIVHCGERARVTMPDAKILAGVRLWDINSHVDAVDVLICPNNLHNILSDVGKSEYDKETYRIDMMARLRKVVKPGGWLFGSYFDVDAERITGVEGELRDRRLIEVLCEDPDAGVEGSAYVRVGTDVWQDFKLSSPNLEKLAYSDDDMSIYHGNDYLRRFDDIQHRRHEMMVIIRVVEWQLSEFVDRQPVKADGFIDPVEISHVDGCLSFEVNRGIPFTPRDLLYLDSRTVIYNMKADGVEARLATNADGVCFVRFRDGKVWRYGTGWPPDISFQVEVIGVGGDPLMWTIVLTDNATRGCRELGYETRMHRARGIIELHDLTIQYPKMGHLRDGLLVDLDCTYPTDGYVLNWLDARSGMVGAGRGAARYVKNEYTYEVCEEGRIIEVDMEGNFIRRRPDRHQPTPDNQLETIRAAWTVDEFNHIYPRLLKQPYSLQSVERLRPTLYMPYYTFTEEEQAYLLLPCRIRSIEMLIWENHGVSARDKFIRALKSLRARFVSAGAFPCANRILHGDELELAKALSDIRLQL